MPQEGCSPHRPATQGWGLPAREPEPPEPDGSLPEPKPARCSHQGRRWPRLPLAAPRATPAQSPLWETCSCVSFKKQPHRATCFRAKHAWFCSHMWRGLTHLPLRGSRQAAAIHESTASSSPPLYKGSQETAPLES